eukprot:SAG11_NODE_5168_length_1641_cov_2.241245_2_plen_72_part_01
MYYEHKNTTGKAESRTANLLYARFARTIARVASPEPLLPARGRAGADAAPSTAQPIAAEAWRSYRRGRCGVS